MSVTALEKLVYARTYTTPHHSQRERILKAALLISTRITHFKEVPRNLGY